jgi:hypothetical protein
MAEILLTSHKRTIKRGLAAMAAIAAKTVFIEKMGS